MLENIKKHKITIITSFVVAVLVCGISIFSTLEYTKYQSSLSPTYTQEDVDQLTEKLDTQLDLVKDLESNIEQLTKDNEKLNKDYLTIQDELKSVFQEMEDLKEPKETTDAEEIAVTTQSIEKKTEPKAEVKATTPKTETKSQTPKTTTKATTGTGVFAGYNVTVLDKTTLATDAYFVYPSYNVEIFQFVSSSGKVLGTMSGQDGLALVTKSGKDSYGSGLWSAQQFNAFRGLGDSAISEPESVGSSEIIQLINAQRRSNGTHELTIDQDLVAFAKIRAEELKTLFSHTRPDGSGLKYTEVIHTGRSTASGAYSSLYNSTAHKNIMMSDDYSSAGAAHFAYNGQNYWVVVFLP